MYTSTHYIKLKASAPQTQQRCVQDYLTYNIIYITVGLFFKLFWAWSTHILPRTEELESDPVPPCKESEKAPELILSVVVYEIQDIILHYFNQCLILLNYHFNTYNHFYVSKHSNQLLQTSYIRRKKTDTNEQISAQFSILCWCHNITKTFRKSKPFESLAQVWEIPQTKTALTRNKYFALVIV